MSIADEARAALERAGLTVVDQKDLNDGLGVQFKTREGPILNVWRSGKCNAQGKNPHLLEGVLEELSGGVSEPQPSRTVFVVYGHDTDARTELEAMLRRWGCEPVMLDQLTSEGDTLIEKLERYGNDIAFSVVLATPDDEGHTRSRPDEHKFRARQNVVLELGMMLTKLGRKKVAILLKQPDEGVMERPSDLDGLIYIPFTDSVGDARVQLAKEMNKQGLRVDLDRL